MGVRALSVLLVVAMLGTAGCLGAKKEDGENVDAAADDDVLNTAAPDGRGKIAAFEETNETESGSGGVDHHHDHWAGRERVLIFETRAMMQPLPNSQNKAVATFRPPEPEPGEDPSMIFEATERVEFTISNPQRHACEPLVTFGGHYYCTDYPAGAPVPDPTGGPSGLILHYKHASTTEWIEAGPIAWNEPRSILITNPVQTDMPHATSSVWEFQVVSPNPHDVTLIFDARAEIIRGVGDVPVWPPHPLFYTEERTWRTVIENVQASACDGSAGCALAGDVSPVIADKVVSYGTRTLYVWVNVTDLQTPNPATAPSTWFLYHRNATGDTNITNPFDYDNMGIEKRELFWILPVDDGGMDSPYADGSRWNFELGASFTTPDNPVRRQSCYGGCADWAAAYTITVRASSDDLPADAYHRYCLDPQDHCG